MKIIDLLNKIAKGEEVPKKIKARGMFWTYEEGFNQYKNPRLQELIKYLFGYYNDCPISLTLKAILNYEVEIIEEEKEIEFDNFSSYTYNVGRVDESNIEEYIHTLFSQQMRLIENQKKIIDLLNDMRDKE